MTTYAQFEPTDEQIKRRRIRQLEYQVKMRDDLARAQDALLSERREHLQDLIDYVAAVLERLGGSSCDECKGTGGVPVEIDVVTSGGWEQDTLMTDEWTDPIDTPCQTCMGLTVLAPRKEMIR